MTLRKLSFVLLFAVLACGKRGDPRPPVPVIPRPTSDLVVTQRADQVILSWSYPSMTTAGRSLTDIRRITVYRYSESLPPSAASDPQAASETVLAPAVPPVVTLFSKIPTIPQAQFEKLSTRVDSIEKANLAAASAGAKLVFTDRPPMRSEDGRPVRLTYAVVTEGGTARSDVSNLAIIVPLPVAVAPAGLVATARPEGIVLTWEKPTTSIDGREAPVITGYHLFRTAPGEQPGEFATPVNSVPATSTTYTDAPSYGEHEYRVTAVAIEGPPAVQSAPSQPVRVTFRDLVAPPAPASMNTLLETNSVRLIWDPVQAPDFAGYRLYRSEGIGHTDIREAGTIPLVAQPITVTNYIDTKVNPGIAFRYAVTAVDTNGNESARTWTGWIVVPKSP